MRILHISKYFPPIRGGIEQVAKDAVDALSDTSERVLCFDGSGLRKEFHRNAEVVRVWSCCKLGPQDISARFWAVLRRELRRYRPNIVLLHVPNPLVSLYVVSLIGRRKETRLVLYWHADILGKGVIYKAFRPVERLLLSRAWRIVVTSAEYLQSSVPLSRFVNRCRVVPNAVTMAKSGMLCAGGSFIQGIRSRWPEKKVAFVGRHVKYKGIPRLLDVAQQMKDVRFLIAGSGPETPSYERTIRERELDNVHLLGEISEQQKNELLSVSDVFAFPSNSRAEAFGISVAEAMLSGVPVVCFRIPGSGLLSLVRDGETGMLVRMNDTVAFANAVRRLLSDSWLRLGLVEAARKRVLELFSFAAYRRSLRAAVLEKDEETNQRTSTAW